VRFESLECDRRVHARLECAHDLGTQPRTESRDDHARRGRQYEDNGGQNQQDAMTGHGESL
jgi:hypothetical protein